MSRAITPSGGEEPLSGTTRLYCQILPNVICSRIGGKLLAVSFRKT